jgi:hypothetical protein
MKAICKAANIGEIRNTRRKFLTLRVSSSTWLQLEFKTHSIFNLPVAPTPLIPESLAEQAIGQTQETTMAKMPTLKTTVEASGYHKPSACLPPHGAHYPPPPPSSQSGFASPYQGVSTSAEHHYFSSSNNINYGYPAVQHQQWPRHFGPARPPPPLPYPYYQSPPYGLL